MNIFVLKYCFLIGAILTSTAFVAGPLNPQNILSSENNGENVTADSVYQFGSEVFYRELDKPGNEYMKSSVAGYSKNLVQTDVQARQYDDQWVQGVTAFKTGYNRCIDAYYELAGIRQMGSSKEKIAVCDKFRDANGEMKRAVAFFSQAKSSSTASSSQGFSVGMVLARVEPIRQSAEDAEIGCMKTVLSDRDGDDDEFGKNLRSTGADIQEMKRIYPELEVLSSDFG